MPDAMLADTKTHWRCEGEGERRMLLLHCTLGHSGAWKGVMAGLSNICRMAAMDLPSHGRSGPHDPRRSWQRQSAAMALELMQRTGTPVDLVGHSFGGTVALRLALEHPALVRSLTLVEPVLFSAAKDAGRPEFDETLVHHAAFFDLLDKGDDRGAAGAFNDFWDEGAGWDRLPEAQKAYMAERIRMIREGGLSVIGEGPDYMALKTIARITRPVLLIEGQ
ncbi:MAG: alpha/beta fold hydrolase, partial [Paracoccaceae bacterium]